MTISLSINEALTIIRGHDLTSLNGTIVALDHPMARNRGERDHGFSFTGI